MQVKYLRDKNGHPYATFWTDGKKFGWSLCHKDDKFVKKVGVAIAKINAQPYYKYVIESAPIPHSIRDDFSDWMMNEFEHYRKKLNE